MKFRALRADEIDVRIGSIMSDGATLLLYQDARCAMNILDETVGAENWQRDHKEVKGNLFCGIGIRSCKLNDGITVADEWVWKWDCGTESNTEKEKGESSDSMKRSAVNWGIARELYTAPKIKIKCKTQKKDGGRGYELSDKWQFFGVYVSDIDYAETENGRTISKLIIKDRNNKVIYDWKNGKESAVKSDKDTNISDGGVDFLEHLIEDVGADKEKLLEYYKVESLYGMTTEQFNSCVATLEKRRKEK